MISKAKTIDQYVNELPEDRKKAISEFRKVILKNIPKGFAEEMSYGMIGYVVPLSMYPNGYRCNPSLPLPLINLGSPKKLYSFAPHGFVCR